MAEPLTEAFEAFHAANPHVYDQLVLRAHRWREETGLEKMSIAMLVEHVRWDLTIQTTTGNRGPEGYKIANAHRAFYARLIMFQETELRTMFRLCEAPEADAWLESKLVEAGY